jgi:ACR3 family arsenite efflux pump ArsB
MKLNREQLERQQIPLYLASVAAAAALSGPATTALAAAINPALALMLFLTFLQVPLAGLGRALARGRFLAALLSANFLALPLLVAVLLPWLPPAPMLRLGVLMVLLSPCIDYVVTFAQLGRADARLLLAATPALLGLQMLLLPVYLALFLGDAAVGLVRAGPFLDAFAWLIAVPLTLAAAVQWWAASRPAGARVAATLAPLPVPATAAVLFIVVAAVLPQLGGAVQAALQVLPVYLAFAVLAPPLGWGVARLFRLEPPAGRAVAFSAATRNSLVILPLAMAVPGAVPLLPAIIVTQTLVELLSELCYVRLIARYGKG